MSRVNAYSGKKIALILDTGALLAKYYRYAPRIKVDIYTTDSAVNEVKDQENKSALIEALELRLIHVEKPGRTFIIKIMEIAKAIGCLHKLSITDVEIAALSLQLRKEYSEVVVVTDDYELQNLLSYMGVSFKPLRTRGIEDLRVFKAYCPVCGYTPGKPSEDTCPLCGSKITRRNLLR
ncbi:MAG: nucleotide-binding protein [Desulfurococcaceae archaeon]